MTFPAKGYIFENLHFQHHQLTNLDGRRYPCSDFELNFMECMEAYGAVKGAELCKKFYEDTRECKQGDLKDLRIKLMNIERAKKVIKGEIKWADRRGQPVPYDGWFAGSFFP